jgi:hypothetical protein
LGSPSLPPAAQPLVTIITIMDVVILLRSIAARGPSPSTIEFTSIAVAGAVDERFDAALGTPIALVILASIASDDRDS